MPDSNDEIQNNWRGRAARNEGLTVFTAQRPRAAVWKGEQMGRAGQTKDLEKAQEQKKKDGAE